MNENEPPEPPNPGPSAAPSPPGDDDVWRTTDGREIPLREMFTHHIGNAKAVLRNWRKGERDPERQRDLKEWYRRFNRELSRRNREWRRGRNVERDDEPA